MVLKLDGVPIYGGFSRSDDGTEVHHFRRSAGETDPNQVRMEEDRVFEELLNGFTDEHRGDREFAGNREGLCEAAINFAQEVFQIRFGKPSDLPARLQARAEAEAASWKDEGQPAVPHCTVKLADGRDVTPEEAVLILCPKE